MPMSRNLLAKLLTPLSVLVANVTGFLIYLLLPKLLAPSQFAVFSLLMSASAFGAALVFEWSRHGLIRFSHVADPDQAAENRATLAQIYRVLVGAMVVCCAIGAAAGAAGVGGAARLGAVGAVVLFASIVSQGVFDGRQAQARARFQNVSFSLAWCVRSVLNIGIAVGAAVWLHDGFAAASAFALANLLTYLLFNDRLALLREERRPSTSALKTILHYGMFIAVSSSLTALFPVAVRLLPSHALGLAEVAGLMLAFDIGTKAIAMTGLTINLLALQGAISAMEHGGTDAGRQKASRQFSLVLTAVLPAGLLAVLCQPYIAHLIVPASYFDSYMAVIGWAILAALVITFRAYALDTVFIVARRSVLSIAGPIVTIVATLAATWPMVALLGNRPSTYAQAAVVGALAGAGVAFALAQRALRFHVNLRELGHIVLALAALGLPQALLALSATLSTFLVAAALGCALFGATVITLDVAGLRGNLMARRR